MRLTSLRQRLETAIRFHSSKSVSVASGFQNWMRTTRSGRLTSTWGSEKYGFHNWVLTFRVHDNGIWLLQCPGNVCTGYQSRPTPVKLEDRSRHLRRFYYPRRVYAITFWQLASSVWKISAVRQFKHKKCEFFRQELEFLGRSVRSEVVKMGDQ